MIIETYNILLLYITGKRISNDIKKIDKFEIRITVSHIIQLFPARRAATNIPVAYVEDNLLISYLLTVVMGEYDPFCWMDLNTPVR